MNTMMRVQGSLLQLSNKDYEIGDKNSIGIRLGSQKYRSSIRHYDRLTRNLTQSGRFDALRNGELTVSCGSSRTGVIPIVPRFRSYRKHPLETGDRA